MGMKALTAALGGLGAILAAFAATSADAQQADAIAKFYQGKQMNVIIFQGAGTTYDVYARLLAKHMGRHIPGNPSMVPQNMVGAGGLKATEYLYGIAPKDGSAIGEISPGNPFEPLLGEVKTDFDPLKFTWLGSMDRNVSVGVSWHTVPLKTIDDVKTHEMITPGTGAGADSEIMPLAFNRLVGTKFKVIPGYPGIARAALAMEQGEIQGIAYWAWTGVKSSHPDWVKDRKLNIIYQTGAGNYAELPGVPSIRDHAKSDIDAKALDLLLARQDIGRPFLAPPAIPADRAKALKAAFAATFKDSAFLSDAKKARADLDFVSAEEVEALFKRVGSYPPEVIERAKAALSRTP
jgi:tripartite-type tricarboxylate transporter receptor subunit TctC